MGIARIQLATLDPLGIALPPKGELALGFGNLFLECNHRILSRGAHRRPLSGQYEHRCRSHSPSTISTTITTRASPQPQPTAGEPCCCISMNTIADAILCP